MLSDQPGPAVAGQRPSQAGGYGKRHEKPGIEAAGGDQEAGCDKGQLARYGQRNADFFDEEQRAEEHDRYHAVQTEDEAQESVSPG